MGGVSLPLAFAPDSPALRFIQQYPREHAEAVAHCAMLYGVRCLSVHASTGGALSLEQLTRLSGFTGAPQPVDGGGGGSYDDVDGPAGAQHEDEAAAVAAEVVAAPSQPRAKQTKGGASSAIRGAAQAWGKQEDAVSKGLAQRRVQPPARPSDGNLLEQQLHALEAELASLKASVNGSQQVAGASAAAVDRLMSISHDDDDEGGGAAPGDDDGWQGEPASDRDSVVAGTNIPAAGWIRCQTEQAPTDNAAAELLRRNG